MSSTWNNQRSKPLLNPLKDPVFLLQQRERKGSNGRWGQYFSPAQAPAYIGDKAYEKQTIEVHSAERERARERHGHTHRDTPPYTKPSIFFTCPLSLRPRCVIDNATAPPTIKGQSFHGDRKEQEKGPKESLFVLPGFGVCRDDRDLSGSGREVRRLLNSAAEKEVFFFFIVGRI